MEVEDMFFQLVFGRITEELHRASTNDAKKRPIMPADMVAPLCSCAKPLVIAIAADPSAFEPIFAIELGKLLGLGF
jgi:hypothetical protein